jgi:hypothetical protein
MSTQKFNVIGSFYFVQSRGKPYNFHDGLKGKAVLSTVTTKKLGVETSQNVVLFDGVTLRLIHVFPALLDHVVALEVVDHPMVGSLVLITDTTVPDKTISEEQLQVLLKSAVKKGQPYN